MESVRFESLEQALQLANKNPEITLENELWVLNAGGFLLVRSICEQVQEQYPDTAFVLNAGNDQAIAQLAMRCFKQVRFDGDEKVKEKLAEMASACDAKLL